MGRLCDRWRAHGTRRAPERRSVQPDTEQRRHRPRDEGHCRSRGRWHRHPGWPRKPDRHVVGRRPSSDHWSGARLRRHDRLLGAGDPGRDHSLRCDGGRVARASHEPGGGPGVTMRWGGRGSNGEGVLFLALLVEIGIFSLIARNFFTITNFFEVMRLSIELGLLAVALTPVIISGGIDLSVGAMMGLSAVLFGAAARDWHLGIAPAGAVALLCGVLGGGLNAVLVSRFEIPPLIVTLGSLSLFRGIAEGLTRGA